MRPLRFGQAWLIAGLALLVAGLVSAVSPGQALVPIAMNDKLVHAAGFLAFMLWFGGVLEARLAPFLVVALSSYGLLIEVLQSLTPTRQPELLDLIADIVGILVGWALSAAGLSGWCAKLESWFLRQKP